MRRCLVRSRVRQLFFGYRFASVSRWETVQSTTDGRGTSSDPLTQRVYSLSLLCCHRLRDLDHCLTDGWTDLFIMDRHDDRTDSLPS